MSSIAAFNSVYKDSVFIFNNPVSSSSNVMFLFYLNETTNQYICPPWRDTHLSGIKQVKLFVAGTNIIVCFSKNNLGNTLPILYFNSTNLTHTKYNCIPFDGSGCTISYNGNSNESVLFAFNEKQLVFCNDLTIPNVTTSWNYATTIPPNITIKGITSNYNGRYLFLCAYNDYIYKYDYLTDTCVKTNSPLKKWVSVSTNYSGQYVVACTDDGYIYSTIDYGYTWFLIKNIPILNLNLKNIKLNEDGNIFYCASYEGYIIKGMLSI